MNLKDEQSQPAKMSGQAKRFKVNQMGLKGDKDAKLSLYGRPKCFWYLKESDSRNRIIPNVNAHHKWAYQCDA